MKQVLFVCEHGSAKSVVAVAHFNRLARERGLPLVAVSRGTAPDEAIHPAALSGLAAERLAPADLPRRLGPEDLAAAARVVVFGDLPEPVGDPRAEVWTVPPISESYGRSRDEIVTRVARLVEELAAPA